MIGKRRGNRIEESGREKKEDRRKRDREKKMKMF